MARVYKHDPVDDLDLEDVCEMGIFYLPIRAIPVIAGLCEVLQWRSRYTSDTAYELGQELYNYLMIEYARRMGVCEMLAEMEKMTAALECICASGRLGNNMGYGNNEQTQLILDNASDYVDYGYVEIPSVSIGHDADRCAIAHLANQAAKEMYTEWLIPAETAALNVLLPAFFGLVAVWLGSFTLGLAVGTVTALAWAALGAWAEGSIENVYNAILSYQDELLCASYNGLLFGIQEAVNRVGEVIDTMGLGAGDTLLLKLCYSGMTYIVCQTAYEEESDWAVGNLPSEGACTSCSDPGVHYWQFPPCPQSWTLTPQPSNSECDTRGYLHYGDQAGAYSETITLDSETIGFYGHATYMFDNPSDEGGWYRLERWISPNWLSALGGDDAVLKMVNPGNVADTPIDNCAAYPELVLPAGDYRIHFLDGVWSRTYALDCIAVFGQSLPSCSPLPE